MKTSFSRAAAGLALAAVVLGAPASRATVVVDQPVAEMAHRSALVVHGTVTAQKVQWDEAHRLIVTRTFVSVREALKGSAGSTVVVREVGGSLDGLNLNVPGHATFAEGEDVILFLDRHPVVDGEYVLEAMAAAKFKVVPSANGPVVTRSLNGLSLARRDGTGMIRPAPGPSVVPDSVPYDVFLKAVREGAALPQLPTPAGVQR